MIKHTLLLAIINLCLSTHVFCSDSVNFSKKEIEARRLQVENDMYQKAISKDLGYYQTLFGVREDKVFETRTFNTGYVLMGGVLIRPVIQVECLYESMNINGFDFRRQPRLFGRDRIFQFSKEDQESLNFLGEVSKLYDKLYKQKVTDEEFIAAMRTYIETHGVNIEKVQYGQNEVVIWLTDGSGHSFLFRSSEEVFGIPEAIPTKPATQPNEIRTRRQLEHQNRVCDCLEKGNVAYKTGPQSFKCIDKDFIERIDHIIKSVKFDESKLVSDYLVTINLIIEELHKIGIYSSSPKEIKDAAIILANWNRDPVEVLKEARARAEAKEGAGLVNGR